MSNLKTQHCSSEPKHSPTTSWHFVEAVNAMYYAIRYHITRATTFFFQLCHFPGTQNHMTKQSTCRILISPAAQVNPFRLFWRSILWLSFVTTCPLHILHVSSFRSNVSRLKHDRFLFSNICKGSLLSLGFSQSWLDLYTPLHIHTGSGMTKQPSH